MRVLGLGGSHHDYCACLVEDGKVVAAIEEERLVRVKIAFGLGPRLQRCLAADYVLNQAGVDASDVDLVVANDFLNPVYAVRYRDRIAWMGHHLSHAASTFYSSPFEQAAVLVMDGRGSTAVRGGHLFGETVSSYIGGPQGLSLVRGSYGRIALAANRLEDSYEDSLGGMYEAVSKSIGFFTSGLMGAPGKTMGLAPYGSARYVERFADFYRLADGKFHQSIAQQDALKVYIASEMARAHSAGERAELRADFAFAVQEHTERNRVFLARWLHDRQRRTGSVPRGLVALEQRHELQAA